MNRASLLLLLLAVPTSSCRLVGTGPAGDARASYPPSAGSADLWPARSGTDRPVLYARDGSPVSAQPGGSVKEMREPIRDVQDEPGTRPYLLELYQRAVDEKDERMFEVSGLDATLRRLESEKVALHADLEAGLGREQGLTQRITELEQENLELASRLVTAQIRRLEAEKLLLEASLEWNRLKVLNTGAKGPSAGFADPPAEGGQ